MAATRTGVEQQIAKKEEGQCVPHIVDYSNETRSIPVARPVDCRHFFSKRATTFHKVGGHATTTTKSSISNNIIQMKCAAPAGGGNKAGHDQQAEEESKQRGMRKRRKLIHREKETKISR